MFRTLSLKTRGLYLVTEVVMFNLTLIDQVYFGKAFEPLQLTMRNKKNVPKMHMSINIATFFTCPGKSAKVPDNLTQCPGSEQLWHV